MSLMINTNPFFIKKENVSLQQKRFVNIVVKMHIPTPFSPRTSIRTTTNWIFVKAPAADALPAIPSARLGTSCRSVGTVNQCAAPVRVFGGLPFRHCTWRRGRGQATSCGFRGRGLLVALDLGEMRLVPLLLGFLLTLSSGGQLREQWQVVAERRKWGSR